MQLSKYLTALLLSVALSACNVTYTASDSVGVSGAQPDDVKLEFAKKVAIRVWDGDLKSNLKTKIPELKDRNLDTLLAIQWVKKVNTNLKDVSTTSSNVFVKCVFKSELPLATGRKAVAICIESIKEEMVEVKATDAI